MKESVYQNKDNCCGCSACVTVCPHNAIKMVRDECGFEYPQINGELCVNCSLCTKVCDFQNPKGSKNNILDVYAMQHKDKHVIKESSSGGAFTAISDWVLSQNGVVYGAVLNSNTFYVIHKRATTKEERDEMRGSKYVQSSMDGVFKQIKKDIAEQKQVLFSGTPCQCAGLVSYLKGHPDNLIIIDLLCHGTPSPQLLVEHIKRIEKQTDKEVISYKYRSKQHGYTHTHEVIFKNNKVMRNSEIQRILKIFVISMRPACFNCKYTNRNRYGDFTIGDMWDCAKLVGITDNRGTSVVFVNTEKGRNILNDINKNCKLIPVEQNKMKQQALRKQVEKNKKSEVFWQDYQKNGYEYVFDKYAPASLKSKLRYLYIKVMHYTRLVILTEMFKKWRAKK